MRWEESHEDGERQQELQAVNAAPEPTARDGVSLGNRLHGRFPGSGRAAPFKATLIPIGVIYGCAAPRRQAHNFPSVRDQHALTVTKIVAALRDERKRLGWSYETLAVATDLSSSCIRHLEKDRATPTLVTLLKLATALRLDLVKLLAAARKPAHSRV